MSQLKVNSIVDASGGSNAQLYGVASPPNSMGFRNRILNGGMVIDQRNAGASVTPTNGAYLLDRYQAILSQTSKYSVQQVTDAPTGYTNSMRITSLSAYSVVASDIFHVLQKIEGFNVADLAWGTASAQAITISFWAKSSLTGTFGGSVVNSAEDRSYPFSYTINAANTWEYKTVSVAGDTTGTWVTNNGIGLRLHFTIGMGSNYTATAGAWTSGAKFAPTGATSVVGTNGATLAITGVQLEAGTNASPFERRDYGRELMMCQRYYSRQGIFGRGNISAHITVPINVNMRTTPSVTTISSYTGDGAAYTVYTDAIATNNFDVKVTWTGGGSTSAYSAEFGASAEL